jgi:Uma2 family endonuclease
VRGRPDTEEEQDAWHRVSRGEAGRHALIVAPPQAASRTARRRIFERLAARSPVATLLPMANPARTRATYEDVIRAPANLVAELIHGVLHTHPRPASPHAAAATALGEELGPPFKRGRGGPGGWILLFEPELHLGEHVLVPDLAGWRRERMPVIRQAPFFTLAPDWICEVLSKSTATIDKTEKLPIYAEHRVSHAWLVDPLMRTLEVLRLADGRWSMLATFVDDAKVRAEPFDAIELDLALLWADVVLDD